MAGQPMSIPTGVLTFEDDVTAEQAEAIVKAWADAAKDHRMIVLPKKATFTPWDLYEPQAHLSEPIRAESATPWLVVAAIINSVAIALLGLAVILLSTAR